MRMKNKLLAFFIGLMILLWILPIVSLSADSTNRYSQDDWISFSGNFDIGYRKTQFFNPEHEVYVGTWDSRMEIWLPPFRESFSWGPYVRGAGISSTSEEAWENAWVSGPGLGFQLYPFSFKALKKNDSILGKFLGPVRIFAEYNWMDYWGEENEWRPEYQIRAGTEYWRNLHANNLHSPLWLEFFGGIYWQSANEFDDKYDSINIAASLRSGLRLPSFGILSMLSPYMVAESIYTENLTYYWENRLLFGGGVRIAPSLESIPTWMNRIVIYVEHVYVSTYYHKIAPSTVPDDDIRVGLSFSFGDWYQ